MDESYNAKCGQYLSYMPTLMQQISMRRKEKKYTGFTLSSIFWHLSLMNFQKEILQQEMNLCPTPGNSLFCNTKYLLMECCLLVKYLKFIECVIPNSLHNWSCMVVWSYMIMVVKLFEIHFFLGNWPQHSFNPWISQVQIKLLFHLHQKMNG